MKKIKYVFIVLGVLMLFPVINGMGCNFNYEYTTPGHEGFGSCKLGQYTLIDYPNPEQDNGYTVLKGLYFYVFGNAAILETSHQDHTKKITDATIESINNANESFWHQISLKRLSKNDVVLYTNRPQSELLVIPFEGRLSMTDK